MAVKKIKWKKLMNNVDGESIFTDTMAQFTHIDTKINAYLANSFSVYALTELATFVRDKLVTDSSLGIWAEMDIYLSSYMEYDKRFVLLVKNKLREYIAFYMKILDDVGVQRHLVYSKEYSNDGNSNSIERGLNSSTPQNSNLYDSEHPESDAKFDQAIADYASAIDKNKSDNESHTQGKSDTVVTGTTWEEAKRNIQMLFYNELKDYIASIPDRIYHYYSLETIPAPELTKKFIEHYYEVRDMLLDE